MYTFIDVFVEIYSNFTTYDFIGIFIRIILDIFFDIVIDIPTDITSAVVIDNTIHIFIILSFCLSLF